MEQMHQIMSALKILHNWAFIIHLLKISNILPLASDFYFASRDLTSYKNDYKKIREDKVRGEVKNRR